MTLIYILVACAIAEVLIKLIGSDNPNNFNYSGGSKCKQTKTMTMTALPMTTAIVVKNSEKNLKRIGLKLTTLT